MASAEDWADWPAAVWERIREQRQPLTWARAQKLASVVCREEKTKYGRESSQRFAKFKQMGVA